MGSGSGALVDLLALVMVVLTDPSPITKPARWVSKGRDAVAARSSGSLKPTASACARPNPAAHNGRSAGRVCQ
eukprot:COSAG01_NODE_43659_length_427_cov_1.685976_1_plen_72_part_10